jgi:rhamnulokinase
MSASLHLAVDLGAESGRVALGRLEGESLEVQLLHRFENTPVQLGDHLYWDLPRLWWEVLNGVSLAPAELATISVDGWGVDFALLEDDELLGLPLHYRDPRHGVAYRDVLARLSRERIFSATGIQFMPINTLYQLWGLRQAQPRLFRAAERFLMLPDLFHFWLSGVARVEWTNASTTQLADPRTRTWAWQLLDELGFPSSLFEEPLPPGSLLGPVHSRWQKRIQGRPLVVAPCTHDTASAVAAVPAEGEGWAYLVSGTWSLVGVERSEPEISPRALALNFTNEGGLGGTTRLLKNVMGLWILQECRRAWGVADYAQLVEAAWAAPPFRALFNPDDPEFLLSNELSRPMPERIAAYCQATHQAPPEAPGAMVRSILESLALAYRKVLEELAELVGPLRRIHVVGGGSQNALACRLLAEVSGLEVWAGPVEATLIGNLLVSAQATGHLGAPLRQVVRASFPPQRYLPEGLPGVEEAYARFRELP